MGLESQARTEHIKPLILFKGLSNLQIKEKDQRDLSKSNLVQLVFQMKIECGKESNQKALELGNYKVLNYGSGSMDRSGDRCKYLGGKICKIGGSVEYGNEKGMEESKLMPGFWLECLGGLCQQQGWQILKAYQFEGQGE